MELSVDLALFDAAAGSDRRAEHALCHAAPRQHGVQRGGKETPGERVGGQDPAAERNRSVPG